MRNKQSDSVADAELSLRTRENRALLIRMGYSARQVEDLYLTSEEIEVLDVSWLRE